MKNQIHHIKKQQVNLILETEEKARLWNKRFSNFYKDEVLPRFSTLLDETVPQDHSYVIDRLEIDLGTIQMDEFTSTFLKYVEKEIKQVLHKASVSKSGRTHTDEKVEVKNDLVLQKSELQRGEKVNGSVERGNTSLKNRKEHVLDCMLHFLNYGALPWNTEIRTIYELEAVIRKEVGVEELSGAVSFQELMSKRAIRQRFYYQFSQGFVEEVWNHLYNEKLTKILSLKKELQKHILDVAKDTSSQNRIKQELSKNIWKIFVESGPTEIGKWSEYFVKFILESISDNVESSEKEVSIFQMIIEKLPPSSELLPHLKSIIKKDNRRKVEEYESNQVDMDEIQEVENFEADKSIEDKKISDTDDSSRDVKHDKTQESLEKREIKIEVDSNEERTKARYRDLKPDVVKEESAKESSEQRNTEDQELDTGKKVDKEPSEMSLEVNKKTETPPDSERGNELQRDAPEILDEYYLRNAGIILTWPYLTRLFGNLGYLETKVFKESSLQQRAIHLLGFIGTGREKCEEHELVLAKFLTAWPLQMPILKDLELTEEEKDSADEMLQSLIIHWSVLKSTSVEGLRESFFKREGKLFKKDEQWRLIIEQESYDMLLDRLPYNISLIKLPWMMEILQVDWA